jgi:hypothetical protein
MTRYVTGFLVALLAVATFKPVAVQSQGVPGAGTPIPGTPLPPVSPPPPAPALATAPVIPPADAVALCRDGTFVIAPATVATCDARGGLQVAMPRQVPPPAPVVAAPVSAVDADAERANSTPPTGATMRCKDGTWLTGAQDATRCANSGGVAMLIAQPLALPPVRP